MPASDVLGSLLPVFFFSSFCNEEGLNGLSYRPSYRISLVALFPLNSIEE